MAAARATTITYFRTSSIPVLFRKEAPTDQGLSGPQVECLMTCLDRSDWRGERRSQSMLSRPQHRKSKLEPQHGRHVAAYFNP
jgi:hypothetical protein